MLANEKSFFVQKNSCVGQLDQKRLFEIKNKFKFVKNLKMSANDDPNQVDSVELTIMAVSGNTRPEIYGNGRHQVAIEIMAKAKKTDEKTGEEKVLNFSKETWIKHLYLRFAESDEKLNWNGTEGWCYTDVKNNFSEEIVPRALSSNGPSDGPSAGSAIIIYYVYTKLSGIKRISVSFDNDNGKHFTTSDNAEGAERMSIPITAVNEIVYTVNDLRMDKVSSEPGQFAFFDPYTLNVKHYSCHYDNFYINLTNKLKIVQSQTVDYFPENDKRRWLTQYRRAPNTNGGNDQYMLAAHPFNTGPQKASFGFDNSTQNGFVIGMRQTVNFNERPNEICFTHLYFGTSDIVFYKNAENAFDAKEFKRDQMWFDLYDQYGNYGKFHFELMQGEPWLKITDYTN